jgi:hypothetical protein
MLKKKKKFYGKNNILVFGRGKYYGREKMRGLDIGKGGWEVLIFKEGINLR